jgi:hypothetical protein
MNIEPGYETLAQILQEALDQAQSGKGKERHATDEPFAQQEICNGARLCGLGAMAFQVRKKILEAVRLIERNGVEAGAPDILGAINYAAAMLLVAREQKPMAEEEGIYADVYPPAGHFHKTWSGGTKFVDSLGPWYAPSDHNMIECASCGKLKPTNTMCKCGW